MQNEYTVLKILLEFHKQKHLESLVYIHGLENSMIQSYEQLPTPIHIDNPVRTRKISYILK